MKCAKDQRDRKLTNLGVASKLTKGNGGHMIEASGLWNRTGLDKD